MPPWYPLEFAVTFVIVMFLTVTAYETFAPHKPCLCVTVAVNSQTTP